MQIETANAVYTLPAKQINIGAISEQLGQNVSLQDIKIQIEIAAPTAATVQLVENAAAQGEFTIVAPPYEFHVKAVYNGTTIDVSKFSAYVERNIAIPDGVDPAKITTGVVIEADGTIRHVPTKVIQVNGKYYAQMNSLTNSTYTVVWNPVVFSDMDGHWAQDAVNDMGSRMVVNGIGEGLFNPDQPVTRAEFTAIIVRGLGLKPEKGAIAFSDVSSSDWYGEAVHTAYVYNLIDGFEDGTFRPKDSITREQAMTIISRAMAITGLKAKLSSHSADFLWSYTDAAMAAQWTRVGIADCLEAGIVTGRSSSVLAPKAPITRAEVAAIVQRLLVKSDLI